MLIISFIIKYFVAAPNATAVMTPNWAVSVSSHCLSISPKLNATLHRGSQIQPPPSHFPPSLIRIPVPVDEPTPEI